MVTYPTFIPRSDVIDALAALRSEWEQAADGGHLIGLKASVGLLLGDLAMSIGMTPEEQVQALGADLVNDLQGVLVTVPGNNGNH